MPPPSVPAVQMPAPAPAPGRSSASLLMWGALLMSGIGLCFSYEAGVSHHPIMGDYYIAYASIPVFERGYSIRSWGVWTLVALAVVYATPAGRTPFWRRFGYWLSVALLLLFVTLPGFFSVGALLLGLVAAILNLLVRRTPDLSAPVASAPLFPGTPTATSTPLAVGAHIPADMPPLPVISPSIPMDTAAPRPADMPPLPPA